ncbi:MAG: hypothetical protein AAF416_21505 [Pseudomonadota bacterium]
MNDMGALLLIGGGVFAGSIVPGPSFIVVCRAALTSRREGILMACDAAVASVAFLMASIEPIARCCSRSKECWSIG